MRQLVDNRWFALTDSAMVIDPEGRIHVVWVDAFDSPKYVDSMDGKVWTSPKKTNFPFSAQDNARPIFFADANRAIYILWRNMANNFFWPNTI